eukprot:393525-Prymnesium_polylepis.2
MALLSTCWVSDSKREEKDVSVREPCAVALCRPQTSQGRTSRSHVLYPSEGRMRRLCRGGLGVCEISPETILPSNTE